MSYTPQEGIDYITDYYAVIGVDQEADSEEVKRALNDSIREYHPDRLQGLAPEFRNKGEQMARILNKARGILLDADKRAEYDDILGSFDGPVSDTGTPTITITRHLQAELSLMSPDEVLAEMASGDERVELMAKSNEGMVALLEKLVEQAGDDAPQDLLAQYDEALLTQDRNLAIKEAQRSDVLGLPALENRQYRASLEYAEDRQLAVEARKSEQLEATRQLVLGGAAARLALLAGETPAASTEVIAASDITLPGYFDIVAEQVTSIAAQRQSIIEKRLAIFQPTYPEADAQKEVQPQVLIGVGGRGNFSWFCGVYEPDEQNVDFGSIPSAIADLLNKEDYRAVIESGYNIITFDALEQVDLHDQLGEALDKYITKYYPEMAE